MLALQDIPAIGADELERWRELSYADLAVEVLHVRSHACAATHMPRTLTLGRQRCAQRFIAEEEISYANLKTIVYKAVAPFALEEVIAMHPLNAEGTLLVCDLWNGPSLAFKDLGMSILCGILDHFLDEEDSRMNILVGTRCAFCLVRARLGAIVTCLLEYAW